MRKVFTPFGLVVLGLALFGTPLGGAGTVRGDELASTQPETKGGGQLTVESTEFKEGEVIPHKYTAIEDGISPPLTWSAVPEKTKSLVVILEDPDAPKPNTPFIHWLLYNLPGKTTSLPAALPTTERLNAPEGLQGSNSAGKTGYFGPKPPKGDPPHHYQFQVFALDSVLDLAPGADRASLLKAMKGHVLAKGSLMGTVERK